MLMTSAIRIVEQKLRQIETLLQEENTVWRLSHLLAQQALCKTLLIELQQPVRTADTQGDTREGI